jgi:hypothetical protein
VRSDSIDFEHYLSFPSRVRDTVNGLQIDQLHVSQPDRWSPFQILIHIIDSEVVYYQRIKRVLTEDNPQLPGWQQTPWIDASHRGGDVAASDLEAQLSLLEAIRERNNAIVRNMTERDWKRTGEHTRDGPLNMTELIMRQIDHAEGHLATLANF